MPLEGGGGLLGWGGIPPPPLLPNEIGAGQAGFTPGCISAVPAALSPKCLTRGKPSACGAISCVTQCRPQAPRPQ